jgi:triosephosphate isomerase
MKPLIVANWKMNPQTMAEAELLFNSIQRGIKKSKNVEVVICPPFLYISNLKSQKSNLKLGAQDVFWERKGAYTGEVSPMMLKDLGCQYVIIGHSERRKYFGETEEMVNKKIKAVLRAKLKPILCIGETKEEKREGKTLGVLRIQIKKALKNLTIKELNNLIIAYEPLWAIGRGTPCDPKEAKEVLLFLRKIFKKLLFLYGGSVNSKNAADYLKKAGFNGLLVGGASLSPREFIEIVRAVSRA